MINILDKITSQREKREWSEYLLSEKADLPQTTISSWYKKQMLPSLTSLEKICKAFDMTMSQFLAEEDENISLTNEQKILLNKWQYLSKEQKEALLNLLEQF